MRFAAAAGAIAILVCAARFCHLDLVWVEEAYGMAAAAEVLRGKVLYRDIWFDKPPLYAFFYTLCGARPGWPLRLLSSLYVLLGCWAAWRFFPDDSGKRERLPLLASILLAVYLTFELPSAAIALAPDLLSVPLHLAAVFLAIRGRTLASGFLCGIALLVNTKAIFVLAACLLWAPKLELVAAAIAPNLIASAAMVYWGAFVPYWEQVWMWGMRYSSDTFVEQPWREGLVRTLNWLGFHAALVIGAAAWLIRDRSWRLAGWILLSFAAVCAGLRFFPRYYFLLLPAMLFAGVQGLAVLPRRWKAVALCTILVPVLRFGPRYLMLGAGDRAWADLAMMEDSRDAAALVKRLARPGDRLLVWGYRPDVFVFSEVPAATRYLDSQPLNGVLADRHLVTDHATALDIAARNMAAFAETRRPDIVVDGLGPLNPRLAADRYPFLHLDDYEIAARTRMSIVYVAKR